MKHTLLMEPVWSGAHIKKCRRWLRAKTGTHYWHIPRSATLKADGTIILYIWCSQISFNVRFEDLTNKEPRKMKCGTCIRRADDFLSIDSATYNPHNWELPKWCPGEDNGQGLCFACGTKSRWSYPDGGEVCENKHKPTSQLLDHFEPCPKHGWKEMSTQNFESSGYKISKVCALYCRACSNPPYYLRTMLA